MLALLIGPNVLWQALSLVPPRTDPARAPARDAARASGVHCPCGQRRPAVRDQCGRGTHPSGPWRYTRRGLRGHRSLAYVDSYEGRDASAIGHLTHAIALYIPNRRNALSEVRDRALLASALIDVGQTTSAQQQLTEAASLGLTESLPPQALFWTAKQLARLGIRRLLDSAQVRTRPSNAGQQAATLALEAEWQLATGRAELAVQTAESALTHQALPDLRDTHAYALERAGRLAEARATATSCRDYARRTPRFPASLSGDSRHRAE